MDNISNIPPMILEIAKLTETPQFLTDNTAFVSIIITGNYISWKIHNTQTENPDNEPVLLSDRLC